MRAAVRMPDWKLKGDAGYTVTGAPVVAEDLTDALAGSTLRLLLIGLAVMALVLCLVFRSRLRLVPLAVALAAVAITFGAMALVGAPLTMASIAVLPVLLGLGVDYAIQYQARVQEAGDPARAARDGACRRSRTAALATGAGFLVLLLSPVPMVRQFGVLLVVGIAIAFALALTAGTAALVDPRRASTRWRARCAAPASWSRRRAAGSGAAVPAARPGRRARVVGAARAPPGPRAGGRPRRWRPSAGRSTRAPRSSPTSSGSSRRTCRPSRTSRRSSGPPASRARSTWSWRAPTSPSPPSCAGCATTSRACSRRYGYSAERGCGDAELCPALSLPDLFRTEASTSDREAIRALLDAVPPYFSSAVITGDRRTANLAFGIRLMSLERQQEIIDDMRRRLDPPEGVTARARGPAGAGGRGQRRAVGPAAADRHARRRPARRARRAAARGPPPRPAGAWARAWVPVVPIALATGWSALVLWLLGIPLNPLSATLGALVLAISTEFAVLLSARFRRRARGRRSIRRPRCAAPTARPARPCWRRARRRSPGSRCSRSPTCAMLRDFGLVTVVDLTVSLLGVLAVLPAVLVLAERRAAVRRAPEPAAAVPA